MTEQGVLHASWLGRVSYSEVALLREAVCTRVVAGSEPHLVLVEHEPVFLIGRRGTLEMLPDAPAELNARGTQVYAVADDSTVTYHGPGQLVGHLILASQADIERTEYVRAVKEGLVETILMFGIGSRSDDGKDGVWVVMPDWKSLQLASIDARVAQGLAVLSFTMNVATDLATLQSTVSHGVTSFHAVGVPAPMKAVVETCAEEIAEALGGTVHTCTIRPPEPQEIPDDSPARLMREVAT